jgi:DNA invertase Pin-like site-specific DNA recombinase
VSSRQAFAYLRVSGAAQAAADRDGLPRQRAAVARRAKALGLELVGEYADEGVSGTLPLAERPGLSALFETILGNGVRAVLVEKADRLARDLVEGELILREFRRAGVRVIESENGTDLTAGDAGNPTATLIRQVLGAVAEFEKSALVSKLRAARERKRRNGGHAVGCYGFGAHPEKPEEVATLERARELRRRVPGRRRATLGEVAAVLNQEQRASRSGKPWTAGTVANVLAS